MKKDVTEYGAQYLCFDRLSVSEDLQDGFNGLDYLNAHALLFDAMQESLLAQQFTGGEGLQRFQYLATNFTFRARSNPGPALIWKRRTMQKVW